MKLVPKSLYNLPECRLKLFPKLIGFMFISTLLYMYIVYHATVNTLKVVILILR